MLVGFTVGNYRSFRDPVSLSMVAAPLRSDDPAVDRDNVQQTDAGLDLLKSAAVYGANACGKTNLLRAYDLLAQLVLGTVPDNHTEPLPVEPFSLRADCDGAPTFFEVVALLGGAQYRYSVTLNSDRIISEQLDRKERRWANLFSRNGLDVTTARGFRRGRGIGSRLHDKRTFLARAADYMAPQAEAVIRWFVSQQVLIGLADRGPTRGELSGYLHGSNVRDRALQLVRSLDVSIQDIVPADAENPSGPLRFRTVHGTYDADGRLARNQDGDLVTAGFHLDLDESMGTNKLVLIVPKLLFALERGAVVVVDEFDARLHPLMTQAILKLFNSQDTNPHGAQLIFATHDTNLLDRRLMRRDQIWFLEKDRTEAAKLYSLAEFRVRQDASFGRDYIRGKYGAVPFVGDLARVLGEPDE